MTAKRKLNKPISEIAQNFADTFICGYGIDRAEIVAKLVLEKIRANKKSLERRYGDKR